MAEQDFTQQPEGEPLIPKRAPVTIRQVLLTPYTDSTGIPLLSDRERPDLIANIDFQKKPNPFRDSPSRYPNGSPVDTPVSMLERGRLAHEYPDMLSILDGVRTVFFPKARKRANGALTFEESLNLTLSLSYLPHYLTYRARSPFASRGELPPSIIVLSNAAQGARAAVGLWGQAHEKDPQLYDQVVDIDESIKLAEEKGRLIGAQTVCAASPEQMNHFLKAVIYGVRGTNNQGLDRFFKYGEVPNLLNFTQPLALGDQLSAELRGRDASFAQAAEELLEKKSKAEIMGVLQRSVIPDLLYYVQNIGQCQVQMNRALNRDTPSKPLTLTEVEQEYTLKVPGLLRRLRQS